MRFLFVDKIIKIEKGKHARMVKNVSISEDYFSHHFPDYPVMPGALMLETVEQAAGILISYSLDYKALAMLELVNKAKFRRIVRPGDQVEVDIKIKDLNQKNADVSAQILLEDESVATMKLSFLLKYEQDLQIAPQINQMKCLYEILTRNVYQNSFF